MADFAQWFHQMQPHLVGSGRWLVGNGPNWVQPEAWDKRKYRVLIARLSPWQDVLMSSTHRLLYAILGQMPKVFPDLAFMPPLRDSGMMREQGIPWWIAVGTKRAPTDFDCIAISNALVQELLNLPVVLKASGLPLRKSERMARPEIPLLILGGANSLHSSALWNEDPMVDGIFVGEEPEWIEAMFARCEEAKRKKMSKADLLTQLEAEIPGFFQPELIGDGTLRKPVVKAHSSVPQVNRYKPFEPMMPAEEVAGVAALHISEGCPSFCSFCAESYGRKPYREVPLSDALVQASAMKRALGLEEIELFSFNFNNHKSIHPMIPALLQRFDRVGLKSQRFDALAEDPTLVRLMRTAGKSSITCGLEGVSDRVRNYLQKGLTEVQLKAALEAMLQEPLRELKVFLIATGQETAEDFEEFRGFLKWFKLLYDRTQRRPRVTFSATPLVRFPWTPLEFADAPDAEQCGRQVRQIKGCVIRAGFDFRSAATEWEAEFSQILVRAKDSRILDAMIVAQERTGHLYAEAIEEHFALEFRKALQEHGLHYHALLRGHSFEFKVPWMRVSPGIERDFLSRMYQKSVEAINHEICLGTTKQAGKCAACDACTPQERKTLMAKRSPETMQELAKKPVERQVRLRVTLTERSALWPYKAMSAWLLRTLMKEIPELELGFRRFAAPEWQKRLDDEIIRVTGEMDLPWVLTEECASLVQGFCGDAKRMQKVQAELGPWMQLHGFDQEAAGQEVLELVYPGYFGPETWLRDKGLKHTLSKVGERRVYAFSKEALKKRIIQDMWTEACPDGQKLTILPQEKFPWNEFFRNCAQFPNSEEWRRVRIQIFYKR